MALADLADELRPTLAEIRRSPLPEGRRWYPFDIFTHLSNLGGLPLCFERLETLAGSRVADIGGSDGDLAFLLERAGCTVDLIDSTRTNMSRLTAARTIKERLGSAVNILDVDLDRQFTLDHRYDFALFLGILYHLKNPYFALEQLARSVGELVLSTRIAAWTAPAGDPNRVRIEHLPVGYLVPPGASNEDPTNYWVFSETALKAIVERAGWSIIELRTVGNPESDPVSRAGDQRAYAYLRSRTYQAGSGSGSPHL